MRVAAVLATFNRSGVLVQALRALGAQERPLDGVVVVDNASADDTLKVIARDFPRVEVVKLDENLGVNGGLAAGLRRAHELGFDAFWLLDDDSEPEPVALAELVQALEANSSADVVGFRGGTLRFGWIRHRRSAQVLRRRPNLGPGVFAMDFVLVDGALIPRRVVDAIGYPPEDYFMMIGDIEYTYRMTLHGFRIGVLEHDRMRNAALGSRGGASGKLPWRAYYKARNHVRMALDYRSPVLLTGCFVRQVHLLAGLCRRREWARARAVISGVVDGLRGRMGRTVDPAETRSVP
jgi:GT2 family glycosyltransferase